MSMLEAASDTVDKEEMTVKRLDNFSIPKVKKTKEGYLRGKITPTRTGVFPYMSPDGSVHYEFRSPEEVFHVDSIESYKMIPITDDHPEQTFVSAENALAHQKGYTGETIEKDGDNIVLTATITHRDLIDKILKNKKLQLSVGYDATLVKKPGVYQGQKYDWVQTDIRANHIAVVEKGRAGISTTMRFDAAQHNFNNEEETMSDDKDVLDTKNLDKEIEIKQTKLDAALTTNELLRNQLEQMTVKFKHTDSALDKVTEELSTLKAVNLDSRVEDLASHRVNLLMHALPHLGNELDAYKGRSNREIMEKAMNSKRKDSMDFTGKSDEYVEGMFDTFIGKSTRAVHKDSAEVLKILSNRYDAAQEKTTGDSIMSKLKTR